MMVNAPFLKEKSVIYYFHNCFFGNSSNQVFHVPRSLQPFPNYNLKLDEAQSQDTCTCKQCVYVCYSYPCIHNHDSIWVPAGVSWFLTLSATTRCTFTSRNVDKVFTCHNILAFIWSALCCTSRFLKSGISCLRAKNITPTHHTSNS